MRLMTLFFLFGSLFGWEHTDWLKEVENRETGEVAQWLREEMRKQVGITEEQKPISLEKGDCKNCIHDAKDLALDPKVYICISFSVPDAIWLSLSKELESYSGVFVVRGLPSNSFQEFSAKLANLKKRGMSATVQIDPLLFQEHKIEHVPTFLSMEGEEANRVSGTVSLKYVLDLFEGGSA